MARIEQTELLDAVGKYPSELSGGMQKRVALARALVTDPGIVLFDEPTSGQDPIRKNAILSMIAQYQKKFGFTAILVSHEIPDVYFISNRILVLYERKVVFQGTPEELEDLEHPFIAGNTLQSRRSAEGNNRGPCPDGIPDGPSRPDETERPAGKMSTILAAGRQPAMIPPACQARRY